MEDQRAAAGPPRGAPHVGAEGRDGGEEDDEAVGRDVVGWVRVAEGEDRGGFREELVRHCVVGWKGVSIGVQGARSVCGWKRR